MSTVEYEVHLFCGLTPTTSSVLGYSVRTLELSAVSSCRARVPTVGASIVLSVPSTAATFSPGLSSTTKVKLLRHGMICREQVNGEKKQRSKKNV
jgi:hypothetical protein